MFGWLFKALDWVRVLVSDEDDRIREIQAGEAVRDAKEWAIRSNEVAPRSRERLLEGVRRNFGPDIERRVRSDWKEARRIYRAERSRMRKRGPSMS